MRTTMLALVLAMSGARAQAAASVNEGRIDYIELPATNMARVKAFYTQVFGWSFTDYGGSYSAFKDGRLAGGFSTDMKPITGGGPMVIIYSANLAGMRAKVLQAGGAVTRDIYTFPGGKRFHFKDPSGNELSVWSDK